jgi:uncharacterized protein YeaO (DUF488 family)
MTFQIKRIYESAKPSDGTRILVDRLWPRGVKKVDAHLDYWMKDVAPSTELRLWFGHLPARLPEFRRRYTAELAGNHNLAELRKLGRGNLVSLLYGARDPKVNHALVLQSVLERGSKKPRVSPAKKTARKKKTAR